MDAISQGELELVRFDTTELLREIQRTLFPNISSHVTCHEIRLVGRSTQRASLLQIEDRVLSRLRMTCQRLIYL